MTCEQFQIPDFAADACKFVEVLTTEISGKTIGYRFGGAAAGPNAMVAGDATLMQALFERLNRLPTLPWMRGNLYLVELDGTDITDMDDIRSALLHLQLDELIMLPDYAENVHCAHALDRAYWATLRLCSRLDMIESRGVGHG